MTTPTSSRDSSSTRGTTTQMVVLYIQFIFTASNQLDPEDDNFIEVPASKKKQGRLSTFIALFKAAKTIQDIQSTF